MDNDAVIDSIIARGIPKSREDVFSGYGDLKFSNGGGGEFFSANVEEYDYYEFLKTDSNGNVLEVIKIHPSVDGSLPNIDMGSILDRIALRYVYNEDTDFLLELGTPIEFIRGIGLRLRSAEVIQELQTLSSIQVEHTFKQIGKVKRYSFFSMELLKDKSIRLYLDPLFVASLRAKQCDYLVFLKSDGLRLLKYELAQRWFFKLSMQSYLLICEEEAVINKKLGLLEDEPFKRHERAFNELYKKLGRLWQYIPMHFKKGYVRYLLVVKVDNVEEYTSVWELNVRDRLKWYLEKEDGGLKWLIENLEELRL